MEAGLRLARDIVQRDAPETGSDRRGVAGPAGGPAEGPVDRLLQLGAPWVAF